MDNDSLRRLFCYSGSDVKEVKMGTDPADISAGLDLQGVA